MQIFTNSKLNSNSSNTKILLLTAARIGDALFGTPAISLLKHNLPNVQIDVLAFSKIAGTIFENNPNINKVFVFSNKHATKKLIAQYPIAINLMHEMLRYVGNSPPKQLISIGIADRTLHRARFIYDFVYSLLESPKDVAFHYEISPQSKDLEKINVLLEKNNIDSDKDILIGYQLGCHRIAGRWWKIWSRNRHLHKKVWPIENYIALANKLKQQYPNIKLILTGSETEKFLAKQFLSQVPWATDFIGNTSLFELAALMDHLRVYITHDTGNLHIACARKTPLITLFGPTKIEFTGPYPLQENIKIIRKTKMSDINVDEVYESVKTFID